MIPLKNHSKDSLLGILRSRGAGLGCNGEVGMRVSVITPTYERLRLENQEFKASWGYTAGPVQKEKQSQIGEWGGKRGKEETQVHRDTTKVIGWLQGHTASAGLSEELSREGRNKDFLWTPILNYGCLTLLDPQVTRTWVAAAPSGLLRRITS